MKMKTLVRILFVFIVLGLVFTGVNLLNAREKAQEKTEEKVEKVEKCKHGETAEHVCMCCPVCKKKLEKKDDQFKAVYKEKTFYFDNEKCKAEFEKDPEKYSQCCKAEVFYVCPMKQCNFKSDKPGKCPKCGMELKKAETHAACCAMHKKEQGHETHKSKDDHPKHKHE
jgi:YHS domain-containing protein